MNPMLKNILAVITGWIVGSIINMSLVKIGHMILPIEGLDPSDMNALAEVMPTLEPKYFIFPFLAHALGTLVGAFIAYNLAATHKMKFALGIGAIFFLLGIMVSFMIPAPTWFAITDILLAYIPMAWIGGKLAAK
tara:strand:- start:469 stop:873 length:405 start_codon:yes stop_codon:yes gene_type:complete